MDSKDLIGIAIEDARSRHAATFELVRFTDSQAMSLLGLYVTLGIATVSGAAFGLAPASGLPAPVATALAAAAVLLFVGAAFCLRVLASADLGLPGREPAFWIWALADQDAKAILLGYMERLAEASAVNKALNTSATGHLGNARLCGALAPLAAFLTGVATAGAGF